MSLGKNGSEGASEQSTIQYEVTYEVAVAQLRPGPVMCSNVLHTW